MLKAPCGVPFAFSASERLSSFRRKLVNGTSFLRKLGAWEWIEAFQMPESTMLKSMIFAILATLVAAAVR
jgi:hypothetical protein